MAELWAWLQGSKTKIGLVVTAILGAIRTQHLVPESWNPWLDLALVITGMLTGLAARAAIAKVESAQVELADIAMDAMDLTQSQKANALAQATTLQMAANTYPKTKGTK